MNRPIAYIQILFKYLKKTQGVVVNIEYEWSEEIEAAARAIASVDGWVVSEDAFPLMGIPSGRAAVYWCRAVAAVSAYMSAVPELRGDRHIKTIDT